MVDKPLDIFRRYFKEEGFYRDIYTAEKTFVATCIFWDD
jgi:hypothetical protein